MNKIVRIIALIMAILMGLSAIGMIAMYVAAETYDSASTNSSIAYAGIEADVYVMEWDNGSQFIESAIL